MNLKFIFVILFLLFYPSNGYCKIGNRPQENLKLYGKEIKFESYSDDKKKFSGKITYPFPLYGWQVEVIYRNNLSISETVRPKGNNVKEKFITEKEASSIAAIAYPKSERGIYRREIKNAHFISHFYEYGVVSLETLLNTFRKKHMGVVGVRCIKYGNNDTYNNIKVNAYH